MRVLAILLCLWLPATLQAEASPARLTTAAIATAHPLATAAGLEMLRRGGNAFDAAVAVTGVLAVVEPYSSGIGGGGFYLLKDARTGDEIMLDAREVAPLAAQRDMYLGADGEPTSDSLEGPLSAGIPGIPAALVMLSNEYGQLPLSVTLAPAIAFAWQGFEVEDYYQRMAGFRKELLASNAEASRLFLLDGEIPPLGHLIVQRDLALTLQKLANAGNAGFYAGETASRLVDSVQSDGGIWTLKDLAEYRVVKRYPVRFDYKGWKFTSVPPPSSGGVALATIFNILEAYDLNEMHEAQRVHLILEAMRLAYRDRAEYLGDSDFVNVPVAQLTSQSHAALRRLWIREGEATASSELPAVEVDTAKGTDTTHFSILDQAGNRVAATLSINYPFGSGYVARGTGVLLNDEMDDFSVKPGAQNAYGLVGAEANAIEPGKRPLSSMSPTFVENDEYLMILGTPGGSRIITMVMLGALEFVQGGDALDVVSRPRFHHQYLPDSITYEAAAFADDVQAELALMGYSFAERKGSYGEDNPVYGNMQVVIHNKQTGASEAASDPRVIGAAGALH